MSRQPPRRWVIGAGGGGGAYTAGAGAGGGGSRWQSEQPGSTKSTRANSARVVMAGPLPHAGAIRYMAGIVNGTTAMLDKALPVQVGNRTQLLMLAVAALALANVFGLISPEHFAKAVEVLAPLGAATFAAKIDRQNAPGLVVATTTGSMPLGPAPV